MSINNVRLLRTLIREMVTEAPYRSSQRVTLDGVRFSGTPNMRATLMAGGIVGLINLYDWAGGLCTVDPADNSFPIKLSKPAAAAVEASAAAAFAANYALYVVTITQAGRRDVDETTSDLANLEEFYAKLDRAEEIWPSGVPKEGLAPAQDLAVLAKLKEILGIYTGCANNVVLSTIPMSTRDEYIKFLNDIGDMASSTFKAGLEEQIIRMTPSAAAALAPAPVKIEVTKSITFSDVQWQRVKTNLK